MRFFSKTCCFDLHFFGFTVNAGDSRNLPRFYCVYMIFGKNRRNLPVLCSQLIVFRIFALYFIVILLNLMVLLIRLLKLPELKALSRF